ncbi:MAG: argininosuccinate lyase, partial [Calditrichaeota bacterium]|nr:argininosuccinate lyase [Calditrichota bacterium]
MKLWQKGIATDREVERFTAGEDAQLDLLLAEFDVLGSLAHVRMLVKTGILSKTDGEALDRALKEVYHEIEAGSFAIEPGVEDVHSQVEKLLTERIGEAGKRIHSGRSRNDQVLLDIRLFVRREIQGIVG